MQRIQQMSRTSTRTEHAQQGDGPTGPRPLPDRARIRRVAEIYYEQVKDAERAGLSTDDLLRRQVDALREFSLELSPDVVNEFMNAFTEESSAAERAWLARRRQWRPARELNPTLVTALIFVVTIFAIALAIIYAV
jgi:FAD/FMN-containing dehydrogenase